ncbi:MFS transporter [Sediminivirga luteola]|uniref:MFS transporter n=1 Tax=Sediminivirga luteola TaxID=1774748 RepID=A0A8J2TVT2_9MICO|nr:MFS transporter [Sediminivirga luteola]GGA05027.1 MFS transporter [Sediminivirga luteola]
MTSSADPVPSADDGAAPGAAPGGPVFSSRWERRRAVTSWALWDWGSAAFNAVIVTFVFSPYLVSGVAADETTGSEQLGYALSIAGFVIAVVAPAVGTRADVAGRHRFWLGFHTVVIAACMAGMFFVQDSPEYLLLGLILMGVGSVFFEFAEVSYNGMLVRLTTAKDFGKVSGFGWGMGYIGGLVLLVLLLVTVISPEVGLFGVTDEDGARYRMVALLAAVWFAVFAVPVLIWGPKAPPRLPAAHAARATGIVAGVRAFLSDYKRLIARLVQMFRTERRTLHFFLAAAIYRDGLAAIFAFAGVLAAGSYGFSSSEVIVLGVAANVVAGIGSILAGWVDDRLGSKTVIVVGLVALIVMALPIAFSDSHAVFWACAMVLSFFVGPVQASSRTFLARITVPGREGENFGLYATTGRAVSFLGPFMFAAAISLLGFQRAGALGIALVLLVGLLIVLPIRPPSRDGVQVP